MSHLSMIILAQVNSEKKRQNGSKRIVIGNKMGVIRKHAAHSPILSDLKTIYQAADEQKAQAALDRVTEKWSPKYPNSMKRWKDNWDAVSPIFKFSTTVRKVIYTTNAIESLNSTYRKLNRQRSVFPSNTALLKALYLATFEAIKKWTTTIRDWGQVYGELSIMYEGRLPEVKVKSFAPRQIQRRSFAALAITLSRKIF